MGAGAAAHSRLAPGAAKLVEGGADDQVFDVDVPRVQHMLVVVGT
jgi:hypothetical protein